MPSCQHVLGIINVAVLNFVGTESAFAMLPKVGMKNKEKATFYVISWTFIIALQGPEINLT